MEAKRAIQASEESPPGLVVPRNPAWPVVIAAASIAVAAYYLSYLAMLVWYEQRMVGSGNFMAAIGDMLLYGQYVHELLLIPAAVLLIRRRRWGVWLHIIYAAATLVILALVAYKVLLSPFRTLFAPGLRGIAHALFDLSPPLIHMIYPVFVLVWFARPKIIRQVRQWNRTVGGCAPSPPRPIDAHPACPSAIAAASITLGALSLTVLVATILWCSRWNSGNIFSRLQWYWLNWFGRLNLAWFAGRVMPGVIGVSLLLSGIALARRWWAAVPAHLAVALLSLAFWLCFRLGYPWTGDRVWDFSFASGGAIGRAYGSYAAGEPDFLILRGRPEVAIAVLANPLFCLYPLFLLAWFARPGAWKQAFAWRRSGMEGRRRGIVLRGLCGTVKACIFGIVLLLPITAALWRAWPKAPPGVDLFGQFVTLPKSGWDYTRDRKIPVRMIVCVGRDGSTFLDGRHVPSLRGMGHAVSEEARASGFWGVAWFAVDEHTPWSLFLRTLKEFYSSFGRWNVALLANGGESGENWMDDLEGCAVGVPLLSLAAPATSPVPSTTGATSAAAERRRVRIVIPSSGPVTVDEQKCEISEIAERLRVSGTSFSGGKGVEVLISASDDTRFGRVFTVIDQCVGSYVSDTVNVESVIFDSSASTQPASPSSPATEF